MGLAIETIGLHVTQAGAPVNPQTLLALPPYAGFVRNFATSDRAWLEFMATHFATFATGDNVTLLSPQLADDVSGINFQPGDNPTSLLMPRQTPQQLYPGDALTFQDTDVTASAVSVVAASILYTNLPGASARLATISQIAGSYNHVKPVRVATTPVAGAWVDTVLGANAAVLKSNRDYAVLGYVADKPLAAVAVLGAFTSNYRLGGPGVAIGYDTAEWFIQMDQQVTPPHIPVFNGKDIGSIFVSVLSATAVATNVTLITAELNLGIVP